MLPQYEVISGLHEVFAVMKIPKCGTTSLGRLTMGSVEAESARNLRKLAFVRDPLERWHSAYQFMSVNDYAPKDYHEFVDYALTIDDEHFRPQHEFCFNRGEPQFDEVYLLSEMSSVLGKMTGQPIEKLNRSRRIEFDEQYRLADITEKYAADFALVERARGVS